jgi:PadR family transcriptional regulator, regulatory protein AphA
VPKDEEPSPDPLLLGFLMAGPGHPYELYREFDRQLGQVWRLGRSQLYARLKGLAEAGFAAYETEEQADRPARKVYRITPSGRKRFLAWLRSPSRRVRDLRLEYLARLYFFGRLGLRGLESLAAGQERLLRGRLEAIDREAAGSGDGYRRLVLDFRRRETLAIIDWLGATLVGRPDGGSDASR